MFRNQLPFDNFRILEVGSIDNQDKFNLQDFVNDLNLEEVLINIDFLSNVEDIDIFVNLFSINFGASLDSGNNQDLIGEINKNLSEVKSFIIEESDNITMKNNRSNSFNLDRIQIKPHLSPSTPLPSQGEGTGVRFP